MILTDSLKKMLQRIKEATQLSLHEDAKPATQEKQTQSFKPLVDAIVSKSSEKALKKSEEPEEKKGGFLSGLFGGAKKIASSEDLKKIDKNLQKGKEMKVGHMVSLRSVGKGVGESRTDTNQTEIGIKDLGLNTKVVPVTSTAIANVRYVPNADDPHAGQTFVTYVGGNKEYEFRQSPEEFKDYMDSTSKGQYTEKVMKLYNRAPGY